MASLRICTLRKGLRYMVLSDITQPSLILDPVRCRHNIKRVIEKTAGQQVLLRPHFKTHQSHHIGRWFREEGIERITVSSVGMAQYFADDDWKDITIAFPVNVRQIEAIRDLSARVKLGLLIVDPDSIRVIGDQIRHEMDLWIKIDVGTHRTGISPDDTTAIERLVEGIHAYPHLHFRGFLAHAGHSYQVRSGKEAQQIYDESLQMLLWLKQKYIADNPDIQISLGDTPGVSMVDHFGEIDELRPGNFVFYDLMQHEIGACSPDDIAVAMACPVVAIHPARLQWIIYGGAIHFSKEYLHYPGDLRYYGRMVELEGPRWNTNDITRNPYIVSLSQEHGVIQCTEHNFHRCKPGDLSLWLPVHSCLTADAMGAYITTDGEILDHYRSHVFP